MDAETNSSDLAVTVLIPMLKRLERHVLNIEARVDQFVPRRHITDAVKQRHRETIQALGGRCPCCGLVLVVDEHGTALNAEYDHFYSRERREFDETWLICRQCHLGMKNRTVFIDEFRSYQKKAKTIDGGQLSLIP